MTEPIYTLDYGQCHCIDPQHDGGACGTYRCRRFETEDFFSYVCDACRAAGHGPILVYDREGADLIGAIDTAISSECNDSLAFHDPSSGYMVYAGWCQDGYRTLRKVKKPQ